MTKKRIITLSLLSLFFVFCFSLFVALVFNKSKIKTERETQEVYYPNPTITRIYCFHKKTFPAPYPEVGRLPDGRL